MNPDKIPNLQWQLASTYHTANVRQFGFQTSDISTHGIDVDTISHAGGSKYKSLCGTTINTDTIIYKVITILLLTLIYLSVIRCNMMLVV